MMPDETPYLQGSLFEEVQVQRLELHIRVAAEALARNGERPQVVRGTGNQGSTVATKWYTFSYLFFDCFFQLPLN